MDGWMVNQWRGMPDKATPALLVFPPFPVFIHMHVVTTGLATHCNHTLTGISYVITHVATLTSVECDQQHCASPPS